MHRTPWFCALAVTVASGAACSSSSSGSGVARSKRLTQLTDCFPAFGDKPCDAGGGACTTLFSCVLPTGN